MFDIGLSELILIGAVALVAVGPEDLPDMLFKLGRAVRQAKMFVGNMRNQYADIMHEAEVQHYRKQLGMPVADEAATDAALTPPNVVEHVGDSKPVPPAVTDFTP